VSFCWGRTGSRPAGWNNKRCQLEALKNTDVPVIDFRICKGYGELVRTMTGLRSLWKEGIFVSQPYSAAGVVVYFSLFGFQLWQEKSGSDNGRGPEGDIVSSDGSSVYLRAIGSVLRDSLRISLPLFKIMIPVLIFVRIVRELGWIEYLALPLEHLMRLVGLPAEMGLVWATAMANNLYGAAVVFLSLAPDQALNVAQVTVLTTMLLVAHALPVEVRIAQKAGSRFWFHLLVRVAGALILGFILHKVYLYTGWLQQENIIFWQGEAGVRAGNLAWAANQLRNLAFIFLIILALVSLMRILNRLRITALLVRLLEFPLRSLGIGREAAFLTIVGMTMGVTYGGGLIIHEAASGNVQPRDVFSAMTLMGLTHSLFEDTLLMVMLGAHLSGILFARLIFSLLVVALLVRCLPFLPDRFVHRFLYRMPVKG